MKTIEKSIEVEVPARTAYNQWTQFEVFPQFMQGIKNVIQLDDKRLHWCAEVAGREKEWDAEILEQIPDERITWRSTVGPKNAGTVSFAPLAPNKTRVSLMLMYEPQGTIESVADAVGLLRNRISSDLENFKEFVEKQSVATGAWRGEIHGGEVFAAEDAWHSNEVEACPECGMVRAAWQRRGVVMNGLTYCCQGCANGTGCTCQVATPLYSSMRSLL